MGTIRGRHTELVSVYVPAGYNLIDVMNQLTQERATAQNIKDKTVRKNVTSALEKIVGYLKLVKHTPNNGLVVFCGNVSPEPGKVDMEMWSFEPPQPMGVRLYRCDQVFLLDPLKDLVKEKEIYGLIVLDAKEANIGLLRGKIIESLKHMDSTVPSKTVKGGMCVDSNTLIQLFNGVIAKVSEFKIENNPILSCDFKNFKVIGASCGNVMQQNAREALKIVTVAPSLNITVTPEHRFFVPGENGIEIKYAEDLRANDNLLAVKRMHIDGISPKFTSELLNHSQKNELLLYQVLGYMLGDGGKYVNRITLYDKDASLLKKYQKIIHLLFKVNNTLKKRNGRNSYELKIYSKRLMDIIDKTFKGIFGKNRKIHENIQKLPIKQLGYFIRGLFDAEGYIDSHGTTVGITMSSEDVIKVLQFLLLRFGVISSYGKDLYKNKYIKHRLRITDTSSLILFSKHIGFSSNKKMGALKKMLSKRSKISFSNQVPLSGKYVLKLARGLKMNTESFPTVQDFFYDKKRMSFNAFEKGVFVYFKARLDKIKNAETYDVRKFRQNLRITQKEIGEKIGCVATTIYDFERGRNKNKRLRKRIKKALKERQLELVKESQKLINFLRILIDGDVIITKVKEVKKVKVNEKFYDISVPNHGNFVANGIIVHNSQHRYDRLREDAIHDFLKKVGESASQILLKENLKGLVVGGPGWIAEKLAKADYLHYQLRQKLLGVKSTSYTGEYGLRELVARSEDLMEEAAVVREKQLLERFFSELKKGGNVTYGVEEVMRALDTGAVDILLISEAFEWVRVGMRCQCGFTVEKDISKERIQEQTCDNCEAPLEAKETEDLAEILSEKAKALGSGVEFISTDTQEGDQFKELGGIGAILRFRMG